MRSLARIGSLTVLVGLAGCVLPPPLPPPPPPLVALPGPGKAQAEFQADDAACRAAADATPPAGTAVVIPVPSQTASNQNATTQPLETQTVQLTPGMVYLRCMTAHNDIVQPLAPVHPAYYGFYPAYPIYYGFGDTYPWLYGGGFGFYGGFGYGFGYRGGFGYRDGFGYRGGFGGDRFGGGGDRFGGGGFGGGGFRR